LQQVHINRLGVNSIEFETDVLDIPLSPGGEYSFELVVINYGSPTHVHLSVDPSLAEYVTFLDDNPYVTSEEYVPVVVRIPYDGRLYSTGNIFVTVGYGSKKDSFTINIGSENPKMGLTVYEPVMATDAQPVSPSSSRQTGKTPGTPFRAIGMRKLLIVITLIVILLLFHTILGNPASLAGENGIFFGFYQSVFLAILFIAAVAYLLGRLPYTRK
jgi:hypothetical protein